MYVCRVSSYRYSVAEQTIKTTKQLSMGVNQLAAFGMKHWQEPVGWDQSRWHGTVLSRCHTSACLAFLPEVKRLPSLSCVSVEDLLGGQPE